MSISRKCFVLTMLFCMHFCPHSYGQSLYIKGQVIDSENKTPLPGVNIYYLNDQENGTISNAQGYFDLETENDSLVFSYVGYETQKFYFKGSSRLNIVSLKPEGIALNEIVVAGFQGSQRLRDISASLRVLKGKDIKQNNEVIITPLLNRVPGVYMHSGALNTNRITIRGIGARSPFSTRDIRAYFNEIPLTNGEGETTLEDIDLSAISQVEILNGPASSIYGAGLGGVIQLNTNSADEYGGKLSLQSRYASYNTLRNTLSYQTSTKTHNTYLNFNDTRSDGYRDNNNYTRTGGLAYSSISLNEKQKLNILANYVYLKAQIPSSIDSSTFVTNPRAAAFVWEQAEGFEEYDKLLVGVSIDSKMGENSKNTTAVFLSFQDQFERRFFNILNDYNQYGGIRTKFDFNFGVSSFFTFGGEYFDERYNWDTFENDNNNQGDPLTSNNESRSYVNIFTQYRYSGIDNLIFDIGFNYNTTEYRYTLRNIPENEDFVGEKRFRGIVSPRFGINYAIHPTNNLFITVNHGFTIPTLSESLLADNTVNTDLNEEYGWNIEGGLKGSRKSFYYSLSIFNMNVNNLLVSRQVTQDQFVNINAGGTLHQGIEFELGYLKAWDQKFAKSLNIWGTGTLANYQFKDFITESEDFSGNQLTGVPERVLNAGIEFETKPGLYVTGNYLSVSRIPINDANSVFSNSYSVTNLQLGWKRSFKRIGVDIMGGVNNLMDEKYASMLAINASAFGNNQPRYYYPGLPRNYYVDLKVDYSW